MAKALVCLGVVVAGAVLTYGSQSPSDQTHVNYVQRAEERGLNRNAALDYSRAHYRSLLDIIKRNESHLSEHGKAADISGLLTEAARYRSEAEREGFTNAAMIDYHRAIHRLTTAVERQQQALDRY
jgi:hypothetical protein